MIAPVHRHSFVVSPKRPQGHGIHRADQHEAGRKRKRHRRAGQRDRVIFERLPQLLQDVTRKFRHLVEEQDAIMGQAHFAGPRGPRTASDQPGIGHGVMWRTERSRPEQAYSFRQYAGDTVNLRGLQGFVKGQCTEGFRRTASPAWSYPILAARS